MAPQSIEEMRDWASTFVAAVRQRSVIQETTMARAGTPPSYRCIKEIFSRANRSASNALTSRSSKKTVGNKTKMKMEYDSPSDDGDIPSFELEADLHLKRGSRLRRSIRFNSRIVFSWFFFIFLVMKPWDCCHLLCFMHLWKLLFVSLILTCLCWYVILWSTFNGRKSLPWLAYVICVKRCKLLKFSRITELKKPYWVPSMKDTSAFINFLEKKNKDR